MRMLKFKQFHEQTAQAATKAFEDKILYAALGQDIGDGERELEAKKAADFFIKEYGIAEKSFKPKKAKGYPNTRTSQPKADIALYGKNKWLSLSVKLRGGFVLQSAENPEEFRGLYYSALSLLEEKYNSQTTVTQEINNWKKKIDHIADSIIGSNSGVSKKDYMVNNKPRRPIWDDVEAKYNKAINQEKNSDIIATLKSTKAAILKRLNEDNEKFAGDFNRESKELEAHCKKVLIDEMGKNKDFNKCIIWESLTGYVKFGRPKSFFDLSSHGPYANFLISPTGLYDIRSETAPIIKKIQVNQWYELQTMPVPGKVQYFIDQIKGKKKRKSHTLEDAINTIQSVKFSSKIKSVILEEAESDLLEDFDTLISELEMLQEKRFTSLVKEKVKSFFKKVFTKLLEIYKNYMLKIKKAVRAIQAPTNISESFAYLNLAPTGSFTLKYSG